MLLPRLRAANYPEGFSASLIANAAPLGLLIPPSSIQIIYAWVTRQSVLKCFLATVMPGLILIILLCALNLVLMARQKRIVVPPPPEKFSCEAARRGTKAFPALMMPVVILGGIYGGIMTPTEAAGVAVLYAIPVGWFIYRGLNRKTFIEALVESGTTTGVVMVMFFTVMIVSRLLIFEDIPGLAEQLIFSVSANPVVALIMINIVIVIIGMLMDDVSGVLLASPLLLPIAMKLGVDPIHFAAIIGVNLGMGNVTPPTAPLLYPRRAGGEYPGKQDAVADHADDPVRLAADTHCHDLRAGCIPLAAEPGLGPLGAGGRDVRISEIVTTPLWIPLQAALSLGPGRHPRRRRGVGGSPYRRGRDRLRRVDRHALG